MPGPGPFREWQQGMRPSTAEENARNAALERQGRRLTGIQGEPGEGEQQETAKYKLAKLTAVAGKVQTLTITATSGTFTLSANGITSSAIPYDSTGAYVESAIRPLFTNGQLASVSGDGPYTVSFNGVYPLMELDDGSLGGTATIVPTIFGWYAWELLTENGLLPDTGTFQQDQTLYEGPNIQGLMAAYEINGNGSVPIDTVVRLWPSSSSDYLIFEVDENVEIIRIRSSVPNADGYYDAVIQKWDIFAKEWVDTEDVWALDANA